MLDPQRFYIGLASTFHDPALAILAPTGEVLFAEATERYLQYKRAYNCEPDSLPRMASLLREHIPPGAEIVLATSWSQRFTTLLDRRADKGGFRLERIAAQSGELRRTLVPGIAERAFGAALRTQQHQSGIGTILGMQQAFGALRIADVRRYRHHLAHAAYGALSSPFSEATCLVVDGMGEQGSSALYAYRAGRLDEVRGGSGPFSIGFFFALLTSLCGFDPDAGEEWKVMGLAPYGRADASLTHLVRQLVCIDDGLRLAPAEQIADAMRLIEARRPPETSNEGWADLARAGQDVFCELMDVLVDEASAVGSDNLILTGGCALNSSYNGTIVGRCGFRSLHVPPAPADDGNALGAALLAWIDDHPGATPPATTVSSPYLGSHVTLSTLERMQPEEPRLRHAGSEVVVREAARLLADGKLVGWVQGRAEFGPRALGNRSLLSDPRPAAAKARLNDKVKLRESFRPFAPSILEDHAAEWFEDFQVSPYMERTLRWREFARNKVPAVVHEDGTGRLQTVTRAGNEQFHDLISCFYELSGVPIVLNTSLNVMGKPIVHSVEDALLIFYTTGLDALVIDDWLLCK